MIEWISTLSASPVASRTIFVASVVFAVLSLELLRKWLERGSQDAKRDRATVVAAVLGTIFAAMFLAGAIDYFATGVKNFLNLTFFLTGTAGFGILVDLMWRFRSGRLGTDEMRRVSAHDL